MYKTVIIHLCMLLVLTIGNEVSAQKKPASKKWTAFVQDLKIDVNKKTKFKVTASVKAESDDNSGSAGIWARVDINKGSKDFFDNMNKRTVTNSDWRSYVVEGFVNKNSKTLNFGGLVTGSGSFYFDNFEVFLESQPGKYKKLKVKNSGFEQIVENTSIPGWKLGTLKKEAVAIDDYLYSNSSDSKEGASSLKIENLDVVVVPDLPTPRPPIKQ